LNELQDQWREKFRQAEVEIAVERAKLARQRADIDERLREAENDASKAAPPAGAGGRPERRSAGRWLARLGLAETDIERRRRR